MTASLDIEEKGEITSKEIENAGPDAPFWSPEEEKSLVRKIDLVLLPMVWIMYLLSYMDRTKYVDSDGAHRSSRNGSDTGSQYRKRKDLGHGDRFGLDVEPIFHCFGCFLYRLCRL